MSTFRRNFLFSALKPLLRDSTQCLEVDGILDLRAGGPHRPGTISSGLYRKGKTSAVGAMERKATTHVGSWLSLSCVPSPAKQVGTSRFRAEAMGNENSAPPAAGAWPDLQHKKRNATAELGRDRPGTETLGPLLKRKIKTAADQAASMLMPPPSSKCLYKHKATHQLGGDLLMNMAETAAPLLKWMQNGANEAAVRTMVPAPSSENLYKHEAMGQLGGDLLMNLDETSVPLLKWIKNDPDEAAVKTMVLPPSSENLLKHKATGQLGGTLFSKQTETAKPSLVKRIATAADEASAEAATKLLSAPPSGCLYKLKSKDQPGRNHPRTVPCELRPMINQMCPHEGSFTMHGNGKLMNTYTVYEVYVYKTQAITYLYGHDWRKFAFDYGLKKGDELRIRNSNGQIYLAGFNMIKAADPLTEQERMSQRATTPAPAPASHSPASAPVPVPAPFTASTQQSPTSALVPVEAPYTTHAQQAPASALVPLAAPFTAPAQQSPASAPVPLEAPFTAPAQQSPASAPARVPAQAHAPAPARSPRSQLIAVATRVVTRTHLKAMFKLPKSISKDLNAGRRGKISLVMESEGLTVEGRYSVSPTDGRLAVTSRWKKFIDGAKLRIGSKLKPMIKDLIRIGSQFIGYREYASKAEEKLAEANNRADALVQKLEQSEAARKKAELVASEAKTEADEAKAKVASVEELQKRLEDVESALNEHKTAQAAREEGILKRLKSQIRRTETQTNQGFDLKNPVNDPLLDTLSYLELHGSEIREGVSNASAGLSTLFPYFFPKKEEPPTFLALAKSFNSSEDLGMKMRWKT
ncbi:hypothetical protein QYE76_018973 [Lolium multiflorum]|uniref:Uncharacterized protein n=1 Tax=Lolium multiflorum TaxID=4521 RepID=A0AAD8Q8G4_LOLMU|nr:hypothetical protein QYE76_018973 [Lolium multiflorum]